MTTPALVVPDERSWLLWGRAVRADGFRPVAAPSAAEALIAPARLPAALAEATRATWRAMPSRRRLVAYDSPLRAGAPVEDVLRAGGPADRTEHEHDGHDGEAEGHDGGDHGDPMAVTGDPSADGLVMEDLDVTLGPLSPPLPGGLVVRLVVDGDVVCTAQPRPALTGAALLPDPTAEAAWAAALAPARGADAIVAVELERALSHAAWAMELGDVLGWAELAERAYDLAVAVAAARAGGAGLSAASGRADRLAALAGASRRLRFRLRGLAFVGEEDVARLDLHGPVARASGAGRDARCDDERYRALGFAPVVRDAGDAEARALVRIEEARAALGLAGRAHGRDDLPPGGGTAVEGPRGPLAVRRSPLGEPPAFVAAGADGSLAIAAERVAGLEWSAAMAALVSFDLPGWSPPS